MSNKLVIAALVILVLLSSMVYAQMGSATGYFVVVDKQANATEDLNQTQDTASAPAITGAVVGAGDDSPGFFDFFKGIFSRIGSWFS